MNKLRVGILTDSNQIPHWAYSMLAEIQKDDCAEIVLVVQKKHPVLRKEDLLTRLRKKYNVLFYFLYLRVERWLYHPNVDAFEEKNIKEIIPGTEVLEVSCVEKQYSDYFHPADIDVIISKNIDVFIRLGFRILRGDILRAARYGIWSFHHGDNTIYRGGPAGCWEVFQQKNEVGSVLQILTEDLDNGIVIYRSWSPVYTLQNNTLNGFFWKTSQFIPRKLKELYRSGWTAFSTKFESDNQALQYYSGRNYKVPTNSEFLPLLFSLCWKWIKQKSGKLFYYKQWILMYSFGQNNVRPTSLFRYKRILPPKNRYWADPCVIFEDGKHFIFFEEVIYQKGKEEGHICVMELSPDGIPGTKAVVLKKDYHLSSPTVFRYKGQIYMIPESSGNATIELYKSVRFPYEWEFVKNIMEGIKAVDTTFFEQDGKCWLYTGFKSLPGTSSSEELYLFYADSLFAEKWTSHPMNPVVSDVRSARPAGRLFWHNNRLYRPSQDCSVRYGYSLIISEIDLISPVGYQEHAVTSIRPEWDKDVFGIHTLTNEENLYVVDALIRRRMHWFRFTKS